MAVVVLSLSGHAWAEEEASGGARARRAAAEEARPAEAGGERRTAAGKARPRGPAIEVHVEGQRTAAGKRGRAIEVHVEGQRISTVASRDPTAASYVIREDELRGPGATVSSVLSRVPGLQVARTGASSDFATVSLRGASSAETPVYLAGVRLNDDMTGAADLSLVPLWMIQRVEVYRGNAPEYADRLGIGGAIFFEPALPRAPRLGAGLGAGSFGERSAWVSVGLGDERAGAVVALSRRAADNDYRYTDDRGTRWISADDRTLRRPNADEEAYDLWSIGRYTLPGGGRVTAIVNGFAREQGVSGLSVDPARAARAEVQRWLGAVAAVAPCARARDGGADRCRLELRTSAMLSRQHLRDPLNELAVLSPRVSSAGARVAEQVAVRYRVADDLQVSASAAYENERLGIDRAGARAGGVRLRASRATVRASASALYAPIPSLEVYALGAVERHATSVDRADEARRTLEPSGRLGARLRLADGGVTLFGNVGRYVRAPALGELYGTSPVVLGNPELRPEQGFSAELGARFAAALPRARAEISGEIVGFSRLASDLVAYRRSAVGVLRPYNVEGARVLGIELTAAASALEHVRAALSLTALDPRDTSPHRQVVNDLVPFQSRLVVAPSLEVYAEPARLGVDRASLGARLHHRSSRVADAAGLVVLPEQATVDLELAILAFGRRVSVRAAIANVLDGRAVDRVGFALPGRSAHATMEVWR